MSKQANTRLIGGFVVGATALIVAGLLLFGSGSLFKKHKKFVLFFPDSVNGLSVGAPVYFRGVKIGSVTDIKVILEKKNLWLRIPVFIEVSPGKLSFVGSGNESNNLLRTTVNSYAFTKMLIKRGLRAQLTMVSLITGQLGINLDFFPKTPARFVHAELSYEQIPTIQSPFSAIAQTVQKIPLSQIADKVLKTLNEIERIIGSSHLDSTLASLNQTVKTAHALLVKLNRQVTPLAQYAKSNLDQSKKMFTNAAKLTAQLNADIPEVVAHLNETLKSAGVTIQGANHAIDGFTSDNSPMRLQLLATLNELAAAARSFRVLTDYLDNHPEAILRGKRK